MSAGLIVTGFPRSGTTLLYCMLRHCVQGYFFDDREHWREQPNRIIKSPRAVFHGPRPDRCIVVLRDPRAILTSRHAAMPDDFFVSAHHCANDHKRGLCEWWAAIKRLLTGPRLPCVLRYEALVRDPESAQATIVETFGLQCVGEFRSFDRARFGHYWERALGGVRPLQLRSAVDDARVQEQFARFPELSDVMADMGYA